MSFTSSEKMVKGSVTKGLKRYHTLLLSNETLLMGENNYNCYIHTQYSLYIKVDPIIHLNESQSTSVIERTFCAFENHGALRGFAAYVLDTSALCQQKHIVHRMLYHISVFWP